MPLTRIVTLSLQRYWRMSRGLTLGVQGAVIDAQGRFLLIRHTHRSGWHFPGGGVEKRETIETAMRRELGEVAGITFHGAPELFGIYGNFNAFPGDHIALYVIRAWRQAVVPRPNTEIAAQGFFCADDLPEDTHPPTRQRIAEILGAAPRADAW